MNELANMRKAEERPGPKRFNKRTGKK